MLCEYEEFGISSKLVERSPVRCNTIAEEKVMM